MNQPTCSPRRWLQFSLRTLFVIMLLVAAFFGGRESMRPAIEAERVKVRQALTMAEKVQMQSLLAAERDFESQLLTRLRDQKRATNAPDPKKMPNPLERP